MRSNTPFFIHKFMLIVVFFYYYIKTKSSTEDHPSPETPTPSLIRSLQSGRPDKFRKRTKKNLLMRHLLPEVAILGFGSLLRSH